MQLKHGGNMSDEIKYWKEQEKKAICLLNSIKYYDDPFFRDKYKYAPIDAFNSKYWLEHKGTTYNRAKPNFPYELDYNKVRSMMNCVIKHYNHTGEKRDLLLLLQHAVDRNIGEQEVLFGYPCQIHLINLTEIFDFQPLFKGHLSSNREWHWTGKEEVYVHANSFNSNGAISIIPQRGELIWNSYGFCRILKRIQAEREEKLTPVPSGNSHEAPAVTLSAKKNEVE